MRSKCLLIFVCAMAVLFSGCNEFTPEEEAVIRSGELCDAAVAAEFREVFSNHWDETLYPAVNDVCQEEEAKAEQKFYSRQKRDAFYTDMYGSDVYGDKTKKNYASYRGRAEKVAELLNTIVGEVEDFIDFIEDEVQDYGTSQTIAALEDALSKIDAEEDYWSWAGCKEEQAEQDVETFGTRLGEFIGDPETGFKPSVQKGRKKWDLGTFDWTEPLSLDFDKAANSDNTIYFLMKATLSWLKANSDVTVDYCISVENSQSYVVGYSNERAFIFSFKTKDGKVAWEDYVYSVQYVGESLLSE